MKNTLFKNKWIQIIYGSLITVAGILAAVFAITNPNNLTSVISIIIAVCCFILGLVYIASSFASELKILFPASLFFGSFCIAFGILLCCNTTILASAIVYLIGALLITYGFVIFIKAITFISLKAKKYQIILFFLLGSALMVLGILSFIYQQEANVAIYVGCGVGLAIYGIVQIVIAIKRLVKESKGATVVVEKDLTKKDKKKEEPKVIDAEVKEIEQK